MHLRSLLSSWYKQENIFEDSICLCFSRMVQTSFSMFVRIFEEDSGIDSHISINESLIIAFSEKTMQGGSSKLNILLSLFLIGKISLLDVLRGTLSLTLALAFITSKIYYSVACYVKTLNIYNGTNLLHP